MVRIPQQVIETINDKKSMKFLATAGTNHTPNVICIDSLTVADDETIICGDPVSKKTKSNLL